MFEATLSFSANPMKNPVEDRMTKLSAKRVTFDGMDALAFYFQEMSTKVDMATQSDLQKDRQSS